MLSRRYTRPGLFRSAGLQMTRKPMFEQLALFLEGEVVAVFDEVEGLEGELWTLGGERGPFVALACGRLFGELLRTARRSSGDAPVGYLELHLVGPEENASRTAWVLGLQPWSAPSGSSRTVASRRSCFDSRMLAPFRNTGSRIGVRGCAALQRRRGDGPDGRPPSVGLSCMSRATLPTLGDRPASCLERYCSMVRR